MIYSNAPLFKSIDKEDLSFKDFNNKLIKYENSFPDLEFEKNVAEEFVSLTLKILMLTCKDSEDDLRR